MRDLLTQVVFANIDNIIAYCEEHKKEFEQFKQSRKVAVVTYEEKNIEA